MIALPLLPHWIIKIGGSLLVVIFAWRAFRVSSHLTSQDPENALWLFFRWLSGAFLIFAFSHIVSHSLQDIITVFGYSYFQDWRRVAGGFDSIIYVVIATTTLFFYNIQRLYQRMEADHHQLEQTSREILALNREMEALVMERTMSEMALGMAHGLRNPLHVIGGFSHRLLRKTNPEDPSRAWVAAIAEEARRIEHMVERFESLAQRKTSFFGQEDLNVIVMSTVDLLRPEVRAKNLVLVTDTCPRHLVGRFNNHLLKVALAHIIRNAVEATSPQGKILIKTAMEKDYAVLIIQDTGRGMPPDVVEKVFVPFYTTKIGGTGLGMVFVRQIVDEHRGVITLESKLGRGTTVTIRLPLRFGETPGVTEEPPLGPQSGN
ncbi:MAG: HAMP domain-containing histidine kinase [Deltaproteobacteria bacterium]|nr:HAMP domain-containing histidine kinase [Deltaproteobacteria bacterium]